MVSIVADLRRRVDPALSVVGFVVQLSKFSLQRVRLPSYWKYRRATDQRDKYVSPTRKEFAHCLAVNDVNYVPSRMALYGTRVKKVFSRANVILDSFEFSTVMPSHSSDRHDESQRVAGSTKSRCHSPIPIRLRPQMELVIHCRF